MIETHKSFQVLCAKLSYFQEGLKKDAMCDILKFIFFNWTWESCIQFHFILQQNANDNKLYITIFSIFFIKHLKKT